MSLERSSAAAAEGVSGAGDGPLVPADSDEPPTVSVVLPTRDTGDDVVESIRHIKRALDELDVTGEVIVSDRSEDLTPLLARWAGARVGRLDRRGYGHACRHAFAQARGEYVVLADPGGAYDLAALPWLFRRATVDSALLSADGLRQPDLVVGSRFAGEIEPGAMPALQRYVGNPLLSWFLRRVYGARVTDADSSFVVIRRAALEELALDSDGPAFTGELVLEAAARDLEIAEVPVSYRATEEARTGAGLAHVVRTAWLLLRHAPGDLFAVPGVAMGTVGLVLMALAFGESQVVVDGSRLAGFGIRSMVAGSLLVLAGAQLVGLGLFATSRRDPDRRPREPVTRAVVERLRPAHGAAVGLVLVGVGGLYAATIVGEWATAGYSALPSVTHDVAAFTVIMLGLLTVFGSVFASVAGKRR